MTKETAKKEDEIKVEVLDPRLKIKKFKSFDNPDEVEEVTLFMSYGLLSALAGQCLKGATDVLQIAADSWLQQRLVEVAVAPRTAAGAPDISDQKVLTANLELLSVDEAERVLNWVAGHLRNFFMRLNQTDLEWAESHQKQFEKLAEKGKSLNNLINGSEALTSDQPAVGQ